MNWISIVVAAICGALAAGAARLLIGNPKERRVHYVLALLIGFLALQGMAQAYVLPPLKMWWQMRQAEAALRTVPAFHAIREHDPKTHAAIVADVRTLLERDASKEELMARVRAHVVQVVQQRLPQAPDDALIAYMHVVVAEMRELHAYGGGLCHRFLFPNPSAPPLDASKYFSKETAEADLAGLARVIQASARDPQSPPSEAEVMPLVQSVFAKLRADHGDGVAQLATPTAAGADRGGICAMTIDLYERILALPPEDGARVLRWMLSRS